MKGVVVAALLLAGCEPTRDVYHSSWTYAGGVEIHSATCRDDCCYIVLTTLYDNEVKHMRGNYIAAGEYGWVSFSWTEDGDRIKDCRTSYGSK